MLKAAKAAKRILHPWAITIEGSDLEFPQENRDLIVKQFKEFLWNRYGRKVEHIMFKEGDEVVGSYYTQIVG